MTNSQLTQVKEVKEAFEALTQLSQLLITGLDQETLSICLRLCEAGVNPEILASVVHELKKEVSTYNENSLNDP